MSSRTLSPGLVVSVGFPRVSEAGWPAQVRLSWDDRFCSTLSLILQPRVPDLSWQWKRSKGTRITYALFKRGSETRQAPGRPTAADCWPARTPRRGVDGTTAGGELHDGPLGTGTPARARGRGPRGCDRVPHPSLPGWPPSFICAAIVDFDLSEE